MKGLYCTRTLQAPKGVASSGSPMATYKSRVRPQRMALSVMGMLLPT